MGWRIVVGIVTIIALVIFNVVLWFTVAMPANIRYSNEFGSSVTMAYDAASLEGIRNEVLEIWNRMNESFDTHNFEHIYNSPWPWDQVKENSMFYQNRYFSQLIERLDHNIQLLNTLRSNATNPVLINDWQTGVINQTRIEMKREGGLDWVIQAAWFLAYAPLAYWCGLIVVIIFIIALLVIVLLVVNAYRAGLLE